MKDGWVPLGKTGRQARVIQIPLTSGELEILITNLSEAEMEYEAFGELYPSKNIIRVKSISP